MQEQVVLLYVMTRGLVTQVPAREIAQFKVDFIDFVRKHYPQILLRIEQSREVDEETEPQHRQRGAGILQEVRRTWRA